MSEVREPSEDGKGPGRRRAAAGGVVLLCVLAVAVFALVRSGGGGSREGGQATSEVSFTPEQAATSITAPPEVYGPLMQLSLGEGPAGTEVTLQGAGFKAGKDFRPVELDWDRAGGLRLLTVEGPQFSVTLKIPADAAVLREGHNIVAVQRDRDGKVVTQTSVPFFVIEPRR